MISYKNLFSQSAAKSITGLLDLLFLPSTVRSGRKGKKVTAPDDFKPILRFAVCSDIHLKGDENQCAALRLGQLFGDMYSYADSCDTYKTLDALVVAGDFTGGGAEKEYEIFNSVIERFKRDETQLLTVLGNHEFINYRDKDASVGYEVYKKYINENVDTHTVINGYHFIGVSYDKDGKKFSGKALWLNKELEEATKENPHKPIFVYHHPHPFATVYGSVNWGDADLRKILNKYPQVVDFSGHSHYAPSDPRSVWQGAFTAVGSGSLAAFMGNLNYIEGDENAPGKSGGFWLAEADENGCIKLRLYDIENRMFFNEYEYYFSELANPAKRTYTWHKQKSLDTAPEFPENTIIDFKKENGDIILSFAQAKGYYEAENYKIAVFSEDKKALFQKTVISEYVRATDECVEVNIGSVPSGTYSVTVKAYSPYAKKGAVLKRKITI